MALMAEVARRPGATRGAFQQAMGAHIARMARYVPGQTPSPSRVYGDVSPQDCSNRECGVPFHWIGSMGTSLGQTMWRMSWVE
jgi:hypothetical protein